MSFASNAARSALLCGLAALAACERVVSVETRDGPERLVVEARLEAVTGSTRARHEVILTTTAPFFRNEPSPPARGAVVSLTERGNSQQLVFRESPTQPGYFSRDDLVVRPGAIYTLRIEWRGQRYEAIDTVPRLVPIDSLYFQKRLLSTATGPDLRATIDLTDPARERNYYVWDQWVDGERQVSSDSTLRTRLIVSDEFFDGVSAKEFQPFSGRPVRSGQSVMIRQFAISASLFRYLSSLNAQAGGSGSPLAYPAESLRGNVANVTDPDARALGYFMAAAVSERGGRVP
jgi:hypothetical protein